MAMYFHLGFWSSFLQEIVALGWLFFPFFGLLAQSWRPHLHGYDILFLLLQDFPFSSKNCFPGVHTIAVYRNLRSVPCVAMMFLQVLFVGIVCITIFVDCINSM